MFHPINSGNQEVISKVIYEKRLMKKDQEISLLQFEIRILKETIELMAGRKRNA